MYISLPITTISKYILYIHTITHTYNVLQDGVVDCPDRIVVMTTNHPEKLDPALIRPGGSSAGGSASGSAGAGAGDSGGAGGSGGAGDSGELQWLTLSPHARLS